MLLMMVCPGCRSSGSGICGRCLASLERCGPVDVIGGVDRVDALYHYDDLARRVVLSAKNRNRLDVLRQLGLLLAERSVALAGERAGSAPAAYDLITWVPASRAGRRRRGFDHGEFLARAVAARLGLRARRLLLRQRGEAQRGGDRAARLGGPRVRAPLACPARVLLVDDVITTGASMAAAAQALRRAGTEAVDALSVTWVA
jgi:predicted amidophosphoribosyltransferase